MRIRALLVIAGLAFGPFPGDAPAADNAAPLTADDLAEALGMHWWAVRLPDNFKPGDTIGIQWISSDGAGITGSSATMVNTSLVAGAIVKIYCHDQPGGPALEIKSPNGELNTTFPAISLNAAALGGLPNGASANNGDILLKLVKRAPDGSLTVAPGNTLNPGDIGLRLVVHTAARN
jgi:hypothetical protein